jgi:hypothetical protein
MRLSPLTLRCGSPKHLRNIIVIISDMGFRPYKELMPMKKIQVDFENFLAHIPDSKCKCRRQRWRDPYSYSCPSPNSFTCL